MIDSKIVSDPTVVAGVGSMEKGLSNFDFPKSPIRIPQLTLFEKGDLVTIKVGPAAGRLGFVYVPRNGNYADSHPYVKDDGIGVAVYEEIKAHPFIDQIVEAMTGDSGPHFQWQFRWFDNSEQLDLVEKANKGSYS